MSTATARTGATPYRAVWRWHFYAGLLSVPVLLVLAVTGALYLFNTEIERWWYASELNVPAGTTAQPAAAQEAAVLAAHPGARIRSVEWPHDPTHVSTWTVRAADGRKLSVLVDPYTAQLTGTLDNATRLMQVVSDLHGELLLGRTGDLLVELVASWTLVMLATGLYLWWPRRWKWRGVLLPRLGTQGRRFWRDLHAIPAVLNAVLVGFLVLSGLPWSGFWGEQLARLGTLSTQAAPSPNFHAPPPRPGTAAAAEGSHHHDPNELALPWTIRQAPVPSGDARGDVGLARVMAIVDERGMASAGPRLRVFYPEGADGVYTVSLVPARAQDQRTLYVNPLDGEVMQDIAWRDYSPLGKSVEWGVMAHMGKQFGAFNLWLALAVCLTLTATLVTGVVLWWRRRPSGRLGAPDAQGQQLPRGLGVVLAALGILFPLAGLSMLLVLGGDFLLRLLRRRSGALSG